VLCRASLIIFLQQHFAFTDCEDWQQSSAFIDSDCSSFNDEYDEHLLQCFCESGAII